MICYNRGIIIFDERQKVSYNKRQRVKKGERKEWKQRFIQKQSYY